jgi:hypothetical protein
MAMPTKDTSLMAWGSNFDTKATASPVTFNLTAGQASSFHTAYAAFAVAYNAVADAREGGTRSKTLTTTKNTAKKNLLAIGRELYGIVQDSSSVSAADKESIGVLVKDKNPSPVPVPANAPGISTLATIGNTVKLRLFDLTDSARRGRPAGTLGAQVFSFVGPTPPNVESDWTFEGVTGKTRVDITFPATVPAGSRVWFTASWFNSRKANGPAATPVGINLPGGSAMAA